MSEQTGNPSLDHLLAPFGVEDLSFRPGSKMGQQGFLVFPYADAREIRDRLDAALGPLNWSEKYQPIGVDEGFICKLSIRINGEWIEKQGVGGPREMQSDQDTLKSAATDSFRRAARAWGIGSHLERLPMFVWPAQLNNKGSYQKWIEEKAMIQQFKIYLEKQTQGMVFKRKDIIWPPRNLSQIAGGEDEDREHTRSDQNTRRQSPAQATQRQPTAQTGHQQQRPAEQKQAAPAQATSKYKWPEQGSPMMKQALVLLAMHAVRFSPEGSKYLVGSGASAASAWGNKDKIWMCDCPDFAKSRKEAQKTDPLPVCVHLTAVKLYTDEQQAKNAQS